MENAAAAAVPEFSLADLDAGDEAVLNVMVGGVPSGWLWTFAGPGHQRTIEQNNRLSKERLRLDAEIERKRNNGKQWKPEIESPDAVRARNVAFVVERLIRWSPVKIEGALVEFSPAVATEFLSDHRKGTFLAQAIEFLADDKSFMQRSAKT